VKRYLLYLAVATGLIAIFLVGVFLFRERTKEHIYESAAERMVAEQIEKRGVKDKRVLQAMRTVPRHKFVPDDFKAYAYEDRPLPIGCGQTISQPYIVALMTELLKVDKEDKVLEVGTGSGYQAAILSQIVREVYTIEIFEELGISAKRKLRELGYSNVKVRIGDGYYGWPEEAPFDAIIVTCAATHIPPPLIAQLREEGRMCIPVGGVFQVQNLMLVEKRDGKITSRNILPVRFVPMLGKH